MFISKKLTRNEVLNSNRISKYNKSLALTILERDGKTIAVFGPNWGFLYAE
jgi:hypothetical protein